MSSFSLVPRPSYPIKLTGYSCARRAKCIGKCILNFANQKSLVRDTRARAVRNVLGNVYLILLTKNLWYEEREQLDSGGGGALSQGAGHDGSFYGYAV